MAYAAIHEEENDGGARELDHLRAAYEATAAPQQERRRRELSKADIATPLRDRMS